MACLEHNNNYSNNNNNGLQFINEVVKNYARHMCCFLIFNIQERQCRQLSVAKHISFGQLVAYYYFIGWWIINKVYYRTVSASNCPEWISTQPLGMYQYSNVCWQSLQVREGTWLRHHRHKQTVRLSERGPHQWHDNHIQHNNKRRCKWLLY